MNCLHEKLFVLDREGAVEAEHSVQLAYLGRRGIQREEQSSRTPLQPKEEEGYG